MVLFLLSSFHLLYVHHEHQFYYQLKLLKSINLKFYITIKLYKKKKKIIIIKYYYKFLISLFKYLFVYII